MESSVKKSKSCVPAIVGALIVQLCVGILYLWSVFKSSVAASFGGWSGVSMVASYMLMAFVVGNFIGGFLNDKKGPKLTAVIGVILFGLGIGLTGLLTESTIGLMYLTYCVMGGLGSGIAYGACISCVQKWLPHRRGLASGLAVSAFGLSTVVFTPVSKWLMGVFTTDGIVNFTPVFLILGIVFLVVGLAATLLISLPDDDYIKSLNLPAAATANVKNYTLSEAIRTVPFWCIFGCIFFINGTWNLTVPLIKDLGMERGLTESMAVFCVSFTGIPNAAGRLIMATISDKIGRAPTMYILCVMTLVGALCMTFIGGIGYIVIVALIAFAYGGPSALNAALSTDFFGPKNSGTNYGVIMLALGLSSIVFNAISNNVLNGAVVPTFIMGAVTAVIPIILMYILTKYQKNWNKN
jgi:OFA family oxalate/formate antiporter-like MFS transporter